MLLIASILTDYDKKICSSILTVDSIVNVKGYSSDVIMSNGQALTLSVKNISVGDKYCEKYSLIHVKDGEYIVISEINLKNKIVPIRK